ncbi:kinesin-like protein Nod [Diabrotica virgifera virgifera]|uniref:Kinesin motor domain-containing protein n=1 Tax=Diabrotica virgifera virgifera TaxID=50390 RepID=A0ABM5L482_DIAVI|nr:kinesin-like protein Nod [Diabrotica virgifera virgifera]
MESNAEFVNVAIRIKPNKSNSESQCLCIISQEPPVLLLVDRSQTFTFDNIFSEDVSQETVYNKTVKPLVHYVKKGYNSTVFAYGQTGTGKTYTMGTEPNVTDQKNVGLILRTLNQFFEYNDDDDSEVEILLSFIEIYKEKAFDLLQNDTNPLKVKGVKVEGFNKEKVYSLNEAIHFLKMGNKNRHTRGTNQNSQSSRSHAIFTIYCNTKHKDIETSAKLNLVDLAGCESVKKTGTSGSSFQEGININRGLLSIGQVMTALSNNSTFIPYRQSVITSILKDSLNKNNFVSLIACVSPIAEDSTETVQTLEFAQRVKRIKSKPEVNEVISQFRKENPLLFQLKMNTPFKRPLFMNTPKPPKQQKLSIISEPSYSSIITDQSHSPKSLSSSVASSITNTLRSSLDSVSAPQALSPIIRKYMTAMESSLMDKIGSVIQSTLKTESREQVMEKENPRTPELTWALIKNEVSKIVKSEVAQLTGNEVRATSSPLGEHLDDVRKILNYDISPLAEPGTSTTEYEFKVPELPAEQKSTSFALSPIENIMPRRSMRLSMRRRSRCSINNNNKSSVVDLEVSIESSLSFREDIKLLEQTLIDNIENSVECSTWKPPVAPRRSMRIRKSVNPLQNKLQGKTKKQLNVLNTPAGKRLLKTTQKDSPHTSHTKGVLHTINYGSSREIGKLQSVGPKTAQHISLFRDIKGKLSTLSDLKQIPGWGPKKFDRFVEQNLLKEELL